MMFLTNRTTTTACPLVAAIYALIAEARGGGPIDPPLFQRLLSSTSKPEAWFDREAAHDDIIAPVPQQGAGIVQAWDAAHASVVLSGVDSISFNDSDHLVGEHTFSVENTGAEDVVLKVGHTPAATMYTFIPDADVLRAASFPNPIVEGEAEIVFSSEYVSHCPFCLSLQIVAFPVAFHLVCINSYNKTTEPSLSQPAPPPT